MEDASGSDSLRSWNFTVNAGHLEPAEVVCIIGNVKELGAWDPEKRIELELHSTTRVWMKSISIPKETVEYRYLICFMVEEGRQLMIKSWESFLYPRVIKVEDDLDKNLIPEEYGCIGSDKKIDRGWLVNENIIQLKLSGNPLNIWRQRYANRKYQIKITPVCLISNSNANSSENLAEAQADSELFDVTDDIVPATFSYVEVASLNGINSTFHSQPVFGAEFLNGDMVVYQIYLLFPFNTAYLIDLYTYSTNSVSGEPPYHACFTYLLPSAFNESEGSVCLPLTSTKNKPLGEIRIEYLIVKPLVHLKCDMKTTYTRYWNKKRCGLDIGHRGSGSSFQTQPQNCSEIRENTVASMKRAISYGADYIEFDVQLSKDLVPVIYHDFHINVCMKKRRNSKETETLEIPIKDLSAEQLKFLKLLHHTEAEKKTQKIFDEDLEEHQPFPTLQYILETLNPYIGFNVEIKWTMELFDGSFELVNPLDINDYLDIILETILEYGGERRIIFSCFNPDVCTAIRLKQNKYPVMFLTQGETTRWPPYKDIRTRSIPSAIQFSTMSEILGVCAHTEDILKDSSLVTRVKQAGLVLFLWGDDNANSETIKYLKNLGVSAIIFDKIHHYQTSDKRESVFFLEARESQQKLILSAAVPSGKETSSKGPERRMSRQLPNIPSPDSLESMDHKI